MAKLSLNDARDKYKKKDKLSYSEAVEASKTYGSLENYNLANDKEGLESLRTRYHGLMLSSANDAEYLRDLDADKYRPLDVNTPRTIKATLPIVGEKELTVNDTRSKSTDYLMKRRDVYDRAMSKLRADIDKYSPVLNDPEDMKKNLASGANWYSRAVEGSQKADDYFRQFENEEDFRNKTAGYGTGVSGDSIEDAAKRWERHVEVQEQIKSRTNSREEREDLAAKDKQYMDTQGRSDQAVVNTFRNASERSNYNGAPNAGDLAKYYNESDYIRWLVGRDDPNNDIDDENYKFERNWTEEQGLQENPETKYEYLTPLEEETFWAMLHYYEDILSDENKGKYPELTGTPIEYAQGWIDEMAYTLGYREDVEAQKRLEKAPTWAKGLATVAANAPVVSWMGAVDAFGDWLGSVMEGKEYNPYGAHSLYMTRSREMQQSTAEDLSKKTPQWIKDLTDEDFGSLFNSAISAEKFVAGGAMLGPVLYTIEMGMETAPASAAEYRAKGIEKDKANLMAATDAAIEMGTEYISAELFVKNYLESAPTSATGVLMRKLVQDVVEGSEEVVGTYAGAAMQQAILGSQSEVSKKMRAEMANGKSAGQAFQAAWDKVGEEARHAFVNAVISSAFVSTPGAVIQGTSINKAYRNEGSFISAEEASALRNLANDLTGVSDIALDKNAAKSVERAAKRYDKNASAKNTGKLSFALREAVEKQNVADVRKAMSENGVSDEDVKEFAPLFERMAEDPDHTFFTEEETEKLLKNETLGKVYTDLFGPESSAGSRMEKYALARAGANAAEGGERTSVRAGSNLYNTPVNVDEKVSDTGTMIDTETNGEITLESKDPIVQRDGKTYLNTSAGEISTENIKYADVKQAELIESVTDLPQAVANTIVENYQGQENVREYVDGMREGILLYGYSGASMSAIPQSSLFSKLDKVDKNYALSVGRALAQNDAAVREKVIEIAEETSADSYKKSVVAENPGLVRNDKAKAARLSSKDIRTLDDFGKANGSRVEFVDELANGAEGEYDPNTATIRISLKAKDPVMVTLVHETIHRIRNVAPEAYNAISDFVQHGMTEKEWRDALNFRGKIYETTDIDVASEEMVADVMAALLKDTNLAKRFVAEHRSAAQKIRDVLHDIANAIARFLNGQRKGKVEEYRLTEIKTLQSRIIAAERLFENALKAANEAVTGKAAARVGINIDTETESANPSRLSLRSWKASEYASNVKLASADLAKALNVSKAKATQYINDVNSIAAIIAADQNRLDFDAAEGLSAFVSNVEYGGSIDFSTICKKRRLMTGTMAAIQDKLGNDVLSVEDYLNIRSMMKERGYEVSCGLCYVEGSRANMGEFASKFRELYAKYHPEAEWQPTQSDVVNADKVEKMRTQHPDVYEEYVHFWNNHGKLRDGDPNLFASQQRPKLFQADTEYNGEILDTFKKGTTVEQKNLNGGLRIQSFSDFEIIHLLDTMQVIMDMSRVGLAGQAYTKVPDFAWAVGGTGLKVNLSMIAKGVDENGNIIYDEVEGMKKSDAEALRNEYSDNVGSILVVFNDEQLSAALNDPFIDFIIPFHRSQWASKHYDAMGLPKGVKDFTSQQNEKLLRKTYHEFRGKLVEDKARNFMPNEYWDFSKTGKENAEEYLRMCAAANKKPKFSNLLVDNGDGSFSLQPDGSTDGYWKLLIDFKMYNNEGVGVPQNPVRPEFNIEQAERMLNEYEGGHKNYPVAQDVVDDFVKGRDTVRQSRRVTPEENARYMELAKDPETNKAELQRMVEEAAKESGLPLKLMHGTNSFGFTTVDYGKGDDHISFWATDEEEVAGSYVRPNFNGEEPTTYVRQIGRPNANRISSSSSAEELIRALQKEKPGIYDGYRPATQSDIDSFRNKIFNEAKNALETLDKYSLPDDVRRVVDDLINDKTIKNFVAAESKLKGTYDIYVNGVYAAQASGALDNLKAYIDHLKRLQPLNTSNTIARPSMIDSDSVRLTTVKELYDAYLDAVDVGGRGVYEIFATANNPLVIDCRGRSWNAIPTEGKMREDLGAETTTREIAKWAHKQGYGTVIFEEVRDAGQYGSSFTTPSTVYAFLDGGENVIKSADPVTYDDQGNIIPLSERFNKNNDDIRYSRKISAEESKHYLGLAKDPQKNETQLREMVRDAATKAGYDSPMLYHGTNAFGFTIPKGYLFATDSEETAGTYSGTKSARNISEQTESNLGMYQLYANADGMLELDANGAETNHIALGDVESDFNNSQAAKSWHQFATINQIIKYAKENGYTGVIVKNVVDSATPESRKITSPATDYVFFSPQSQVKSADPVVYDNNGKVIPLEERFNPENDDIRYSLKQGEEKTIYIPDGKTDNGASISFTDLILDGKKLGETRSLGTNLPRNQWIGIAKDGRVVGRVKLGDPIIITKDSPEYRNSYIKGTEYDIGENEKKKYYPIIDTQDFRDNPRPIKRNGNYGVYDLQDGDIRESRRSAQEKWDAGEKLTESQFYSFYSAHKLNLRGLPNIQEQIESIKSEGFKGDAGFGHNLMPTRQSTKYPTIDKYNTMLELEKEGVYEKGYADKWKAEQGEEYGKPVPSNASEAKYGPRKGDYILLVAKPGAEITKNVDRVKEGYKPKFDYEIVQADYDYQPYYEMYSKAYDAAQERYSRRGTAELVEQYGKIPEGERPFRNVEVPQRTSSNRRVSQTVRTVLEAEATPDTLVPSIEEMVADGDFSYETYTDDQAMEDAQSIIKRKGYAPALADWLNSVRKGTVSKANTTMGWELYRNAAQSGDTESALTVLRAMVGHQRNAAQALQASRILKKMTPEAQLYNAQKMLEQIIEDYKKKTKKDLDISIDPDLASLFLEARDQETRDDILGKIFQQIGRQTPSTLREKFQAWRYMAMLTNPQTHIRNLAGNLGFMPVVAVKDLTATGIESAIRFVTGGKFEGTKGNILGKGGAELLKAAWNDYANVMDEALGEGKYTEESYANKNVQKGHRVFKFVPLEGVRRGNTWLLDKEDVLFNKPHYVMAMAQYCKARGISAEQIRKGEGLEGARAYAIKEAQKATYRDTNVFSQAVSKLGRYRGDSKLLKAGSMAVEGVLPFRKTPANILVRGLEYSPLGLLKSITHDAAGVLLNAKMQEAQANGKEITPAMRRMQKLVTPMTAAEMIDHLSAGLTGTGLTLLGILLAGAGLVRLVGHGDDDDKKSAFDKLLGHQHYALEIGGTSITLDWLAPEALPLFVGVNLAEEARRSKDGLKMQDLLNAVSNISEPLLEMSCLQGVNSLFENWQDTKSDGMNALMGALSSAATSYVTQYVPTIFGKAERLFEDKRYKTYRDSNSFLTGGLQYTLGQVSAKIPGWDYHQVPYIDAWGREETTGNFGTKVFNNFVNPAFVKTINEEDMETELLRLYDLFKDDEVTIFPSAAKRSVSSNGEEKDLTMGEFETYAKAQGGTAYAVIGHMVDTAAYKELPDELKVKAVDNAYTYAHQTALTTVGLDVSQNENWVNKAMDAKKQGISPDQYIVAKAAISDVEGIKDKDGKTIDNSSGLLKMQAIYNIPGLSDAQRKYLFGCFGVGKKVIDYSKSQVESELRKMR